MLPRPQPGKITFQNTEARCPQLPEQAVLFRRRENSAAHPQETLPESAGRCGIGAGAAKLPLLAVLESGTPPPPHALPKVQEGSTQTALRACATVFPPPCKDPAPNLGSLQLGHRSLEWS